MQVYVTPFSNRTKLTTAPSQPVPAPSVQEAQGMFQGAPVMSYSRRLIILQVGDDDRLAVSDYRFV